MSRPLIIVHSVLAGLQVVTGGAMVSELFGERVGGYIMLGIGAVQAGVAYYTNATTTPNQQVVYRRDDDGNARAGDASALPTGSVPTPGVATQVASDLGLHP